MNRLRKVCFALVSMVALLVLWLLPGHAIIGSTDQLQRTRLETTAIPHNLQKITSENASQLKQLVRFGNGTISKVIWSPDGQHLAFSGSLGVWIYRADALQKPE